MVCGFPGKGRLGIGILVNYLCGTAISSRWEGANYRTASQFVTFLAD